MEVRTTITVRAADVTDADTFLAMIDALADYEKLDRPDDAARNRLIADGFATDTPRFQTVFAMKDSNPVGYATYCYLYSTFRARPTLYLEDLFILPEARRNGAGAAIFAYLKEEAVEKECGRIEWMCLNWNTPAQEFYARQEATILDEWLYYRINLDEPTGDIQN